MELISIRRFSKRSRCIDVAKNSTRKTSRKNETYGFRIFRKYGLTKEREKK
jgi:hypothetical protein